MNNEKAKEILDKLVKRLDLVVTGVLLGLLCLMVYLFLTEKNYSLSDPDQPPAKQWMVKLPMDRLMPEGTPAPEASNAAEYNQVAGYFLKASTDINSDEAARRLIVVNMFDLKAVDDAALTLTLNQRYNEAERLFGAGQTAQALAVVEEILAQDPNHKPAQELRNTIRNRPSQ